MSSATAPRSRDQIEREVRDLGWWYQYFELPGGVYTGDGRPPAYRPEERFRLIEPYVPADLTGKSVLDVGGNAGYFSMQMLKRGAARCVLVDPFEEFCRQAKYVADLHSFALEVVTEDVHTYVLTTEERFDYVVFLGLFYHLKYPGLVLDRLAEMTRGRLYFQSHTVGDASRRYEERPDYAPAKDDDVIRDPAFPKMAFIERLYNGDPTNWWIPNPAALEPLVRSAGMRVVAHPQVQVVVAEPDKPFGKRVYEKLVFPEYGKAGGAVHPGPQRVDADLWAKLLAQRDEAKKG